MMAEQRASLFSETFSEPTIKELVIGRGDRIDITIWEAPPASLFGSSGSAVAGGNSAFISDGGRLARQTGLPGQIVGADGNVRVPFVGVVIAAGRTPQQVANEIERRLRGKAHEPQAMVSLANNAATNVVVVGEVANSLRMPLTEKRERLLDALAAAGGTRQPIGKSTVQLTRGSVAETLPLSTIITDPRQNVALQADDVVTVLYRPYSFTALGAVSRNGEIEFEGTGLTLAQALGRVGGLDDNKAAARGVFIFRLADAHDLNIASDGRGQTTPDGKLPIIFRANLSDPQTFFLAQSFPIRDKDVIYVTNAPLADLQKFVSIIGSLVYPIASVQNTIR